MDVRRSQRSGGVQDAVEDLALTHPDVEGTTLTGAVA